MKSEFDSFNDACFSEARGVFGEVSFTILNRPYSGVLNEFQASRTQDIDGIMVAIDATFVCGLEQFEDLTKPLEKTLSGLHLETDGKRYRIETATVDSISVTLALSTASANSRS